MFLWKFNLGSASLQLCFGMQGFELAFDKSIPCIMSLAGGPGYVMRTEVEALKEQLREELRLMQEHRRQMGVTGEQMCAGSSFAPQDPPLHPPAPPEDDDADSVDP
ncbi:hypothetical protein PIB30_069973 [Stylosanthes scabra]|uniref:Uncharacterized protein n=1 Tax=Stylosanthes scabra TaxID=79078 RepID=A0ABU6UPD1_9FABA|nr:hypothetical protein [Stylosanthes scabra]